MERSDEAGRGTGEGGSGVVGLLAFPFAAAFRFGGIARAVELRVWEEGEECGAPELLLPFLPASPSDLCSPLVQTKHISG